MSAITELVPPREPWWMPMLPSPVEPVPPDENSDCNYRFLSDENEPDMPTWEWADGTVVRLKVKP